MAMRMMPPGAGILSEAFVALHEIKLVLGRRVSTIPNHLAMFYEPTGTGETRPSKEYTL
jgi:hypothetical protein